MTYNSHKDVVATGSVRLVRAGLTEQGRALAMRAGDVVLAVDYKPFRGGASALRDCFVAAAGKPVALTVQRGDQAVTVMSHTWALGRWEACPAGRDVPVSRPAGGELTNWEVLRDPQGACDLHALRRSTLALCAPVFWLLQMRLWMPLATVCTGLLAALLVSPWLALGVHVIAGLHLWRHGSAYVRADRMAQGMWPAMVLAAASEAEAMQIFARVSTDARFVFAPQSDAGKAAAPLGKLASAA